MSYVCIIFLDARFSQTKNHLKSLSHTSKPGHPLSLVVARLLWLSACLGTYIQFYMQDSFSSRDQAAQASAVSRGSHVLWLKVQRGKGGERHEHMSTDSQRSYNGRKRGWGFLQALKRNTNRGQKYITEGSSRLLCKAGCTLLNDE